MNAGAMINACFCHQWPEAFGRPPVPEPSVYELGRPSMLEPVPWGFNIISATEWCDRCQCDHGSTPRSIGEERP